jgi:hypothetical protein
MEALEFVEFWFGILEVCKKFMIPWDANGNLADCRLLNALGILSIY